MNLDKQTALNRLSEIEKETKGLRAIIESADKPKTIFERVTDISSAIIELGEGDSEVKEYRLLQRAGASLKTLQGQEIALFCKAMNEGIKMSWKNTTQKKYYIWFDFERSVYSSFVIDFHYYCYSCRSISARHTYESEQKAKHGAKCIEQLLYDYYVD